MNDFFNEYSIPLFSITGLGGLYLCIEKIYYCCKRRQRNAIEDKNNAPVQTTQRDTQINPLRDVCIEYGPPHNTKHNVNSETVKNAVKVLTANNNRLPKKNNIVKNNLYKVYFPPTSIRKMNKV